MQHILLVTFPFFALVLCGYVAVRRRLLPPEAISGLNSFVLFFALPCMLYRFTTKTSIGQLLDAGVFLTYLACALAMVALTIATTRKGAIGWNDASFGALVAAFPNSGFIGIPLLVTLLGQRVAAPVIIALAVDMVITSSLCIGLSRLSMAAGHGARWRGLRAMKGIVVNPLPWAIALGGLASALGFTLWQPVTRTVEMLADAATPAALFTMGAMIARSSPATAPAASQGVRRTSDVPQVVFYKLVVHPALVFGVGTLMMALGAPLVPFSLAVLVLMAALPSASNVPMLSERFGADSGRVARIVFLSTALSLLTFSSVTALVGIALRHLDSAGIARAPGAYAKRVGQDSNRHPIKLAANPRQCLLSGLPWRIQPDSSV